MMALWSDGFLNEELSRKTSVFGLRLWVVICICFGACIVLVLFFLSLRLTSCRRVGGPLPLPYSPPPHARSRRRNHSSSTSRIGPRPSPRTSPRSTATATNRPHPPLPMYRSTSARRTAEWFLLITATSGGPLQLRPPHRPLGRPAERPWARPPAWGEEGARRMCCIWGGGTGIRCGSWRRVSTGWPQRTSSGKAVTASCTAASWPITPPSPSKTCSIIEDKQRRNSKWRWKRLNVFATKILLDCLDTVLRLPTRRMLVYEYVENGNLEQWLHGDVGEVSSLTWDIRMNIILGTAKGLAYLHEGLEPKVVHREIKASNILLD